MSTNRCSRRKQGPARPKVLHWWCPLWTVHGPFVNTLPLLETHQDTFHFVFANMLLYRDLTILRPKTGRAMLPGGTSLMMHHGCLTTIFAKWVFLQMATTAGDLQSLDRRLLGHHQHRSTLFFLISIEHSETCFCSTICALRDWRGDGRSKRRDIYVPFILWHKESRPHKFQSRYSYIKRHSLGSTV